MINQNKIAEIEIKVTYQEYKKIQTYFPYSFLKKYIITTIIIFCISLLTLLPPESSTISELLLANLVFMVIIFLLLKGIDLLFRKVNYKRKLKKNIDSIKYTLCFYHDYFEKKSKDIVQKIEYSDIWKIKEIDNRIYILLDQKNIIPILKEDCSSQLIDFIKRSKTLNSKVSNTIEDINEYIEPHKKYFKMRIFLIILFILTLFSLWFGLAVVSILTYLHFPSSVINYFPSMKISIYSFFVEVPSALMIPYLWGCFLCLPISILSIILGIIYRKKGLKCLKNIVAGFIVGVLLFIIGCIPSIYDFKLEQDYQKAYSYQKLVGVEFPSNGRFFELEVDNSNISSMSYLLFEDTLETRNFYNNLQIKEYWIQKQKISTSLAQLIPIVCESKQEQCYYSTYIHELDTYNQIPSELGEYHVECMVYDPDILSLKIIKYVYQNYV